MLKQMMCNSGYKMLLISHRCSAKFCETLRAVNRADND